MCPDLIKVSNVSKGYKIKTSSSLFKPTFKKINALHDLSFNYNTAGNIGVLGRNGAGKTTLARGLIQSQRPGEDVPSPTYTLVQTYDLPNYELWHCDLYRLNHPDEVHEIGLLDAFEDAVCLVEWPDKLGEYFPKDALRIDIAFKGEGRCLTMNTPWEDKLRTLKNV